MAAAKAGGTDAEVGRQLTATLPQSTTGRTFLTRRVLPESQILPTMTGEAMWRTFVNTTEDRDSKQPAPKAVRMVMLLYMFHEKLDLKSEAINFTVLNHIYR